MIVGNRPKVLLVEDERTLAGIIADTLEDEGFKVVLASDGVEGLKRFNMDNPDLVIADVMLPRMDGFEMARTIRNRSEIVPILFLTARSSLNDVVEGFELGGNDYLRKPFQMKELVLRAKVLAKKVMGESCNTGRHVIGKYVFNSTTQILSAGDSEHSLSYMESQILKRLCAMQNEVLPVQTIIAELWLEDSYYSRNSLHGFIHKLRKYLAADSRVKILNVRGIGYKLTVGL